jgi:hypothetical protein
VLLTATVALHALAGSIALVAMWVPIFSKKGGRVHRRAGRVYAHAMTAVVVLAWAACAQNLALGRNVSGVPLLALLALLAFGNLRFGLNVLSVEPPSRFARALALAMVGAGVGGLVHGLVDDQVLMLPFSALCLYFGVQHTRAYRAPPVARNARIAAHLGNVLGSCIAAWTAFLVVTAHGQLPVPRLLVWMAPTLVFTPVIVLWGRAWARRGTA